MSSIGLQAAAVGEDRGGQQGQAEAPLRASASYGRSSLHAWGVPPEEAQDLPRDLARSGRSSVTG